jgi:sigma-B regulation protein RsbU (phosphoserine phosphatase)
VFVALSVALVRDRGRTQNARIVEIGTLVFMAAVLMNNLANLLRFRLTFDPELPGFAAFVAALARVVVLRMIAGEERLASIEKELEIARKIQATILPQKAPALPGLAIAARYAPMEAVAGDFYDFLVVDDRRIGFLVADVSGHGVPAALIASMVKVAIAGQLAHAADPAQVLAGMNQTLSGKLKGQFVTAAYLFVDVAAGVVRFASAGHPALLRRSGAARDVEPVTANGLALGLRARSAYAATERPLVPCDRFLLYTDRLFEARNAAGEFFGEGRVRQLLAESSGGAEECASSLLAACSAWTGNGPHTDDLTLVVVDVSFSSAPTRPDRPAGSAA